MFRRLRWTFVALGLAVLALGGASIFSRPDDEVLYSPRAPLVSCLPTECLFIYILEVGNTGRETQEQVSVHLRAEVLQTALLKPTVRNFGKVDRPVAVSEQEGVRTYALGAVKPGERIELTVLLRHKERTQGPPWEQILVGVTAAKGTARPGDPAAITLGRVLFAVFGSRLW